MDSKSTDNMSDEEILEAAEKIKRNPKRCRLEKRIDHCKEVFLNRADRLEKTIQVGLGVIIALLILSMCINWFDADTREHRAKIRDAKSKNFLLDIQKMKSERRKTLRPRNNTPVRKKETPVRVYGDNSWD